MASSTPRTATPAIRPVFEEPDELETAAAGDELAAPPAVDALEPVAVLVATVMPPDDAVLLETLCDEVETRLGAGPPPNVATSELVAEVCEEGDVVVVVDAGPNELEPALLGTMVDVSV